MSEIPEDLKQRYEKLASYKPMEVAVTDIWVRDWLALIERIARAEAKVAALFAAVHEASALIHRNQISEGLHKLDSLIKEQP